MIYIILKLIILVFFSLIIDANTEIIDKIKKSIG